jgi:septal ring factor EnvC (AmiA/AmiB activator)
MKYQFPALMVLLAMIGSVYADGDVYLCIGENGSKEYKNTGSVKGCKKVDVASPTLIPAPAKRSTALQTVSLKSMSAPADFPKVDSNTQKLRDNDRRQILLDEMKSEQDKLAGLKKDFNNGEPERQADERNFAKYEERVTAMRDDISRTEKNIEALQRELKREGGDIK